MASLDDGCCKMCAGKLGFLLAVCLFVSSIYDSTHLSVHLVLFIPSFTFLLSYE